MKRTRKRGWGERVVRRGGAGVALYVGPATESISKCMEKVATAKIKIARSNNDGSVTQGLGWEACYSTGAKGKSTDAKLWI